MCGRYALTSTGDFVDHYDLPALPAALSANYNAAPTQTMPVITGVGAGHQLELMRWGIPRFIGPGKVKDVFNTRADKAFSSWKKLVMTQRLLVPASGFYEWRRLADATRQPYFIRPKDTSLFSFAGLWNTWTDQTGQVIKTYSILTTEPNREMAAVHDRMPVILHREDEAAWLAPDHDNDRAVLESLLHPYEDNGLDLFEVSRDVNNVRNNDAHLIARLTS